MGRAPGGGQPSPRFLSSPPSLGSGGAENWRLEIRWRQRWLTEAWLPRGRGWTCPDVTLPNGHTVCRSFRKPNSRKLSRLAQPHGALAVQEARGAPSRVPVPREEPHIGLGGGRRKASRPWGQCKPQIRLSGEPRHPLLSREYSCVLEHFTLGCLWNLTYAPSKEVDSSPVGESGHVAAGVDACPELRMDQLCRQARSLDALPSTHPQSLLGIRFLS